MGNIIDYAKEQLEQFAERPFCQVDSLILSQLTYIKFEPLFTGEYGELTFHDLLRAELLPAFFKNIRDRESNEALLIAVAMSPRFRDTRIRNYVNHVNESIAEQFSAVTFLLPDGSSYIGFRGTDATFTGWKEDFNMSFITPVPSQKSALAYLNAIPADSESVLRVGGHSKGGNLAVYSAMYCNDSLHSRIFDIYSHDGPGFCNDIFSTPEFKRIEARIHKTLPTQSVVGMLLETQEQYQTVESNRFWMMQHDPFSWQIENGDFVYAERISPGADYLNKSLNAWIVNMSNEQRSLLADTLFSILEAGGKKSFQELSTSWRHELPEMYGAIKNLDPETRGFVAQIIKELLASPFKIRKKDTETAAKLLPSKDPE